MTKPTLHLAFAAAAVLLLVTSGSLPARPMPERILFDDFGHQDVAQLARRGWTVRTRAGGPGAHAASWSAANVALVPDPLRPGNRLLRLTARTDGTPFGTSQAEVATAARVFGEGTYAARVRFSDAPVTGPVGDRVVQTFFGIGKLARPLDPDYSEIDFEYLPNGGWGRHGPTLLATSWETYSEEPPVERMTTTPRATSHAGWHVYAIQVAGGAVRYFVDGRRVAAHGGRYYPEGSMAVSFNLWFQRDGLVASRTSRAYTQDVDWVFHQAGVALTPQEVDAKVAALRRGRVRFRDGVS